MTRLGHLAIALLVLFSGAGVASAQTVPTKTITFYNNSSDQTLYPVIQAPIINGTDVRDLWMQAQFNVANVNTQVFNTTQLYKIYVNRNGGVPPQTSVTLTIPFYTQLLPTNAGNLGKVNDQFVDWWNAMRVYVFDGKDAADAAYNYSVDRKGNVIPPIPVNPVAGAALPTCASSSTTCEPLVIKCLRHRLSDLRSGAADRVHLRGRAGSAAQPDPQHRSQLRQLQHLGRGPDLPAGRDRGARQPTPQNTYLGSAQDLAPVPRRARGVHRQRRLVAVLCPGLLQCRRTRPFRLPRRPPAARPTPSPQLPSTDTLYAESFRNPPPAPPVLSSDTLAGIGKLGQVAQGTLDLWNRCTSATPVQSPTCTKIRQVQSFFAASFQQCFPGQPLPGAGAVPAERLWLGAVSRLRHAAGQGRGLRSDDPHLLRAAVQFLRSHRAAAGRLQSLRQADPPDPGLERLRVLDRRCRGVQEPAGRRGRDHDRGPAGAGEPDPDALADRSDLSDLLRRRCAPASASPPARAVLEEAPALFTVLVHVGASRTGGSARSAWWPGRSSPCFFASAASSRSIPAAPGSASCGSCRRSPTFPVSDGAAAGLGSMR